MPHFKKIPLDIIDKPENEIQEIIDSLPYRQFATSMDELSDHAFVIKQVLVTNHRVSIKDTLHRCFLYTSTKYKQKYNIMGVPFDKIPDYLWNMYDTNKQ